MTVSEAELKKCNLLATIERHGKNGNIAVCPLLGYGIKQGAVACNRLREIGGGYVIASGGRVVDEFPFPCCGLMSEVGVDEAITEISRLEQQAHALNVNKRIDPFITLSFLALPVIPDIRLLDTGLFDVPRSEFIR